MVTRISDSRNVHLEKCFRVLLRVLEGPEEVGASWLMKEFGYCRKQALRVLRSIAIVAEEEGIGCEEVSYRPLGGDGYGHMKGAEEGRFKLSTKWRKKHGFC